MLCIDTGIDPVTKLINQVKELQQRVEVLEKAQRQQQYKEQVKNELNRIP